MTNGQQAKLWLDAWVAVTVSGLLAPSILVLRLGFRRWLPGLEGSLPTQAWAEVADPIAGTLSLAVGWGVLGEKWLAFLPIAFGAWGDGAAGSVSAKVSRGRVRSLWPSATMLGPIGRESLDAIAKAHRLSGNNVSPIYGRYLFGRVR